MPILDWLGKQQSIAKASSIPFRVLREDASLSAGDLDAGNMLIQGDNLDALRALQPYYAGRVKCIYIDPPYNNRSAFAHYDDALEHSQWLDMIYARLVILKSLLREDGSIWISIDGTESAYLKVLTDEIFGRTNHVTEIAWQQRTTRENRKVFSENWESVLLYARNRPRFEATRNGLALTDEIRARYKNPDNDSRGPWQSVSAKAQSGHGTPSQFYTLTSPNGTVHTLSGGLCWLYTQPRMEEEIAKGNIWFGRDGTGVPRIKSFLRDNKGDVTPDTLWLAKDVGTSGDAKREVLALFPHDVFDTPKPERLIQRIISIASAPGDLVLDSFLGSGTTAAVAMKMGRRFIGIENGDHAVTHCAPRLTKVVEGEQGGISKAIGWTGGSGYRFYRLGEEVLDPFGLVNPDVRFRDLASLLWFLETGQGLRRVARNPLIGTHDGTAYYLLFNGILGDRRPESGNVLNLDTLAELPAHDGPRIVYGEACRLGPTRLQRERITFKQIPRDLRID